MSFYFLLRAIKPRVDKVPVRINDVGHDAFVAGGNHSEWANAFDVDDGGDVYQSVRHVSSVLHDRCGAVVEQGLRLPSSVWKIWQIVGSPAHNTKTFSSNRA